MYHFENFDYARVRERRKELVAQALAQYGLERKKGALELLRWLREKGIRTAVATATDEERATRYLTEIGVLPYLDQLVCATMVENGKPMPDVYLHACRVLGEKPEDCMAVEDSPNGVLSAFRAGLRTIMVPDLTAPDETIRDCLYGVAEELTGILKFLD